MQEMESITNNTEGHQWCRPLGCTVQLGTAWNGILHISAEQELSLPSLSYTSGSQPRQDGDKTSLFWRLWVYLVGRAGFPGSWAGKESTCNAGDPGLIPGLGRGGPGNPLQHSSLENPHGQRRLVGYSPWGCRVRQDWAIKLSTVGRAQWCY